MSVPEASSSVVSPLPALGWKEHGALPEWSVPRLRMKLDTGARTSALHVEDLETIGDVAGDDDQPLPLLRFTILVGSRDEPQRRTVETPAVAFKRVRDTGAKAELRPVVRTRIMCGPLDVEADITLTDRGGMNFRMLLGRRTLSGHCVVDPSGSYLYSRPPPLRRTT